MCHSCRYEVQAPNFWHFGKWSYYLSKFWWCSSVRLHVHISLIRCNKFAFIYMILVKPYFIALKRIHWYLYGTLSHVLRLRPSIHHLVSYTDVEWESCPQTRRFTYGFLFRDNIVSWSSMRQHVASHSNIEVDIEELPMYLLNPYGCI